MTLAIDGKLIDTRVKAMRDALDHNYPDIHPRQSLSANTQLPANSLQDMEAAIGHAKWTLCSIQQSLTDKCPLSAEAEMKWLNSFIDANDLRGAAHTKGGQSGFSCEFFDPVSPH